MANEGRKSSGYAGDMGLDLLTAREQAHSILRHVPSHVTVVAAAKGSSAEQVAEVLAAGIRVVGHNHIPEARRMHSVTSLNAEWHFIGRLRRHDVRASALRLFDMIQTVDSIALAEKIDAVCTNADLHMPVLIEINSGREPQKAGVPPEQAEALIGAVSRLTHVHVKGLMTMGPFSESPDDYRACFAETRRLFEHLRLAGIPGVEMRHLSMGMSGSYQVAIQEGATMVRLGSILFGPR